MDLFSAAKRLNKPFVFTESNREQELPIGAHGLIGDGDTAALVRADGAIDWLCMPRFDSPSIFASILDSQKGGESAIRPAQRPYESLQRYDPATNVLETLFQIPERGVVRLTDYMPWSDDPRSGMHEIHRRVECLEGQVEMEVTFDPRFSYGEDTPQLEIGDHGVMASGKEGERLVAALGGASRWTLDERGGVRTKLRLRSGQRHWMVISWDAPRPEPVASYRPFEHLRTTRAHWREFSNRLRYDGPWRHYVQRSALCLKLLMYAPTGAMVAAPTASLPEWLGGGRNWDYRFVWTRDAALAVRAANLIGFGREARDFFHFVRDTIDTNAGLQVMYTVEGNDVPDERTLAHLRGYRGSGPVRVGNGARDQVQLDTSGALVDAAHLHELFGGTLTVRAWRKLQHVIEDVRRVWTNPDHGIWEPRNGRSHNVHSKMMSWVALDRGAGIARTFGDQALHDAWKRCAGEIHRDICAKGLDPKGRHFVSQYGGNNADGALLLMATHNFLEDDHPLLHRTVEWVRNELGDGPFLYRYRAEDGVGGPEGAFVLCGFWLAEALALQGHIEEAQQIFVAHAEASNHLGLLAEEIDPGTGELLGNMPQAFSHLGLINAALRIDYALRLRDEGSALGPHLVSQSVRQRA